MKRDRISGIKHIAAALAARWGVPRVSNASVYRYQQRDVDPLPTMIVISRIIIDSAELDAWAGRHKFRERRPHG